MKTKIRPAMIDSADIWAAEQYEKGFLEPINEEEQNLFEYIILHYL